MAGNGPDPREFLERAQRMLGELFGDTGRGTGHDTGRGTGRGDDPWAEATRRREPSAAQQRENLTFALATRAVEALEDLALDVAAIRQRLERTQGRTPDPRPRTDGGGPGSPGE